jgi:uncharacterized protein DUF6941
LSDEVKEVPKADIDVDKTWRKPVLQSILFCDHANQTDDGKTNLVGIFDRIFVHPEKKVTTAFFLFVRTSQTHKGPIKVRCVTPDSEILFTISYDATESNVQFSEAMPAFVQYLGQLRFVAKAEGIYWLDVSFNDELLGGVPLMIEYRKTEAKESGTDTYP